jgi:glutathionylspermidine synthase
MMERIPKLPRPDYEARLVAQGLSFHGVDGYWNEHACYRFAPAEVAQIEAATAELHAMSVHALEHVVAHGDLGRLGIPSAFWEAIAESARRRDFSLYGRFDLAYDGRSPPKLLEYNADTPTGLLEAAVCQWHWLADCYPLCDQFNSIHERLVARWRDLPATGALHMACMEDIEEDWVFITYLMDTAVQAGRAPRRLSIEQIGWDAGRGSFVDLDAAPIDWLFKLYPWEWLMREDFGPHITRSATRFIEPMWKSVLSCKGLLPLLWELYPDHPNLLPAYFEAGRLQDYARKPLFSREGANVELVDAGRCIARGEGPYGAEGFIYQALYRLPQFDSRYPVIGAWVVDGQPAGMGIREDASPLTTNLSSFVPHYIAA